MRRVLLILTILCLICLDASATKRALIVCIGDYPAESGWNKLAAQNDKQLVLDLLDRCGFQSANIVCLADAAATYLSIISALEQLAVICCSGDQVYIHFSCHGQQITDQDGDEALLDPKDRLDETIVPYDANIAYNWHGYKGDHHLLDDTINMYMERIRNAVGRRGSILLVADACHSAGIAREDASADTLHFRGAIDAFSQPYQGKPGKPSVSPVNFVSFSACKDFETNFEVDVDGFRYGRLTYAVNHCLKPGMTADELASAIETIYRQLPMPKGKSQSVRYELPDNLKNRVLFDAR